VFHRAAVEHVSDYLAMKLVVLADGNAHLYPYPFQKIASYIRGSAGCRKRASPWKTPAAVEAPANLCAVSDSIPPPAITTPGSATIFSQQIFYTFLTNNQYLSAKKLIVCEKLNAKLSKIDKFTL
jgi:hypothetical protein